MSENVKLTQDELQSIRKIAEQETNAVTQIGNIEYQLKTLKEQKAKTFESITELGNQRIRLMDELQKKYGLGTINIESGEFTSTE